MDRNVMRLFLRRCLVVLLPVPLVLLAVYLAVDPFMVLRDYDKYPPDTMHTGINKGLISYINFNRYNDSLRYDSFILGSSVSIPYKCDKWAEKLPEGASIFHFDSSSESIRSLRYKIEYLRKHAYDFKNALIVVPPRWFGFYRMDAPVYIDHYAINPEVPFLYYHWKHLQNFYDREFIKSYLVSKASGRPVQASQEGVIDTQPISIYPPRNEETMPPWDDSIRRYPEEFYARRATVFTLPRIAKPWTEVMPDEVISDEQEADLRAIKDLLKDVDYHIIVGPMLTKTYMDPTTAQKMRDIFGDRFHDFSRSAQWACDIDTLFLDDIHYRSPLASQFLDSIYPGR